MSDENTYNNLICGEFGSRAFTESLITNLNPPSTKIEIHKSKMAEKMHILVVLLIDYELFLTLLLLGLYYVIYAY